MKFPFHARAPAMHAQSVEAIQATIQRALSSAGLDIGTGPMLDVTQTIRRALAGGAGGVRADAAVDGVIDLPGTAVPDTGGGSFQRLRYSGNGGSRAYKVYVPAAAATAPRALLVMLHGCTQSADDFAAGTQMNRLADAHGLLVVYPEQCAQANSSRCWNWFQPQDQARGAGEPALIAGITREVAQRHGADLSRVFVAGLSAGAAMAVVLGQTYPDLFAAVGAHSGLPHASAWDLPSALAAMKGRGPAAGAARAGAPAPAVPLIVFHGDRDHTVQHRNGEQLVQQALQAHAARSGGAALLASTHSGSTAAGRRYTRTVHADAQGHARVEHWTLHGAGHAWSGGHASGSHTDGQGPDASAEMLRFFMALPGAAEAR